MSWLLAAVVAPAPPRPVPELAPPAASTVVTVPDVVLLPLWPTAEAAPVLLTTVPALVTVLVSRRVAVELVLPPAGTAPPLVDVEAMLLVMLVLAKSMPSP